MISNQCKGLLWRDWLTFGGILRWWLAFWVVLLWVTIIFQHPIAIAIWACSLTFICVPTLMAHEIMEGSLEFSLSLPPTRKQRYLTRLALVGGTIALGLFVGMAAIAFEWPQLGWSLFTSSAMTQSFQYTPQLYEYSMGIGISFAYFCFCYAGVMSTSGRLTSLSVILLAAIFTGLLTALLNLIFGQVFDLTSSTSSTLTGCLLIVCGVMALVWGYYKYQRLEAVNIPHAAGGGSMGIWIGIGAAVILVLWILFVFLMYGNQKRSSKETMERAISISNEPMSSSASAVSTTDPTNAPQLSPQPKIPED
jgi:hypothetical protein